MKGSVTATVARRRLPKRLKPFFWDYEFDELSWTTDRDLIIARVLAEGNWEATRWLRRQATDAAIRRWIEQRKGRGLDSKRLRLWELILNLPHREVTRWLAAPARRVWDGRARG